MQERKRSVLITGCSDGGLGAALAVAFHEAGLKVHATARDPSKMADLKSRGIEILQLDVLDESSIAACVSKISSLDILINNAGAAYSMPVSDLSISETRKLFDLNVFSYIAVSQAFMPFLIKSKGMIVNQTSVAGVCTIPFQSAYNASKAAIALFSDHQRLELAPFGMKVVDLKTALVKSNFIKNHKEREGSASVPKGSIYEPAKEVVEKALRQDQYTDAGIPADEWAKSVVKKLLRKDPPSQIWKGETAWLAWLNTILPFGTFDGFVKKMSGLDVVERMVAK